MPLINGQKMACEPCIRGHRSTKCTHASERLMVPVRKPGRPLSSCPHPSSRPCACAAVTAAIPRRQKCHCGPPDTAAVEDQPAKDPSSTTASTTASTPPSPPKPATAGFRVQKQGAKVGPSRKQSVDIAGLQRMHASQINVVPLYNDNGMSPQLSSTNGSPTPMPDASLYASIAVTPRDSSFRSAESALYPMFPYAPAPIMVPTGQTEPTVNGQNGVSTNGTTANSGPETLRSCCGGGANGPKSPRVTPTLTPTPPPVSVNTSDVSSDDVVIGPAAKSCCSSKTNSTQREKKHAPGHAPGVMPPPGVSFAPNGIMMPSPFQPPMVMASGMYPFYAQPNIFNFPPQYGSYMQPLQPEQWRQVMAAMAFGQNVGGQPFGMAGPLPMQQQQQQQHHHHQQQQQQQETPTAPNESSWTSHQCSCGDSCQCVGCAAHPYNEATQDYVRSAWNLMKEDPEIGNAHANGGVTHLNGVTTDGGGNASNGEQEEAANASSNRTTTPIKPHHDGARSPVAAQTPSDAASGASEEQALCASDFFFVSYPFGDSCAGETMSCPCGDDCQCIGCAIHNNPGAMTGAKHEPV